MSDDRTLAPMALDTILPMIRTLHALQERAGAKERTAERGDAGGVEECHSAAMLEERIRQPITVAGRVLECDARAWHWQGDDIALFASVDSWHALLFLSGEVSMRAHGYGPNIAAALADAQERYRAAIADTLLRMGGLLREVVL